MTLELKVPPPAVGLVLAAVMWGLAKLLPATLAQLIARIADGTLSNNGARQAFDALWDDPLVGQSVRTTVQFIVMGVVPTVFIALSTL